MGDSLGLYRSLDENGPLTSAELAHDTGLKERYVREWLAYQAASDYVRYDADSRRFELTPEQAAVLADEQSPAYMLKAFDAAAAYLGNQPLVEDAFRHGGGVGWANQTGCLFCAVAGFFRPGYEANLVSTWLPALDGVVDKLERGARVADVGCGHGLSTLIMAAAFPNSEFVGFDFHAHSIDAAREHAREYGSPENARFEIATAKAYPGNDYDLVTCFDCLHDMGDPAGVAAHVKSTLKPDGSWMIVEPLRPRRTRGQPEPRWPTVLRGLDDGLRTDVPGPGGRSGTRRTKPARRGYERSSSTREGSANCGAQPRRRSTSFSRRANQ